MQASGCDAIYQAIDIGTTTVTGFWLQIRMWPRWMGRGRGSLCWSENTIWRVYTVYCPIFRHTRPNLSKLPKPRMRMGHRKSIHDAMSQHNSSKYPHVLPKHITQNPHFTTIIFIIQLLSPTSLHSPQLFHNYSTYPQYLPNQTIPTFAPTVVPHGATNPPPAPAALPFPPRCFAGPGASGVYIKERLQEPIFRYFYRRYLTYAI